LLFAWLDKIFILLSDKKDIICLFTFENRLTE